MDSRFFMNALRFAFTGIVVFVLLQVTAEGQESPADGGAEETKAMPPRLQEMVETYEREQARLLAPVEAKYDQALQRLKVELTRNGNIEAAVEVNELIASRKGGPVGENAADSDGDSKSKVADTRWKWGESSGVLELKENGDAMHTSWGSTPGKWRHVTDDILKLTSPGTIFIVHLLPEGTAIVTSAVGSSVTLTPL